ncbi:MAG: DUF3859 domain-containing protein [Planctomycetes bacterium]|nr:DUF3859 domain-containing protein [Planctomycetota bacterium]
MKSKFKAKLKSIGIYQDYNKKSKQVPKLIKYTTQVPTRLGIEFGYIVHIEKAKGKVIDFTIEHPPFHNSQGKVAPPFKGSVHIKNNDYLWYLGDTVWEPIHDKTGIWRLITKIDGQVIADESLTLHKDNLED